MLGITIDRMKVGDAAELSKTVSETDVYLYAGISGDFNPAHLDEAYAGRPSSRPHRPRHALGGFISALLGRGCRGRDHLPATGAELSGARPHGGHDHGAGGGGGVDPEKNRARLMTTCRNQDGTVVLDGEAVVMPPKAPKS
jgi:3-hydroxybutyryl-CoA dehydratase